MPPGGAAKAIVGFRASGCLSSRQTLDQSFWSRARSDPKALDYGSVWGNSAEPRSPQLVEVRGTKVPRVLSWTATFARGGPAQPYGHAAQAVRSGPPFPSGDLTAGRRGSDIQPSQTTVDDRRYSGLVGRGKSTVASGRGGGCRTAKASLDPWPTTVWSALGFEGCLAQASLRAGGAEGWVVSRCARGSLSCRSWPEARGPSDPANSRFLG